MLKKLLLAGDKFMHKFYLKQPEFTHSTCGLFAKHLERIEKFRETDNLNLICKNKLNKAFFSHDAAYSDTKNLTKRVISDKILKNKAYKIAVNCYI